VLVVAALLALIISNTPWSSWYEQLLQVRGPTLGYVSPMTFEQRWHAAQQQDRKSA